MKKYFCMFAIAIVILFVGCANKVTLQHDTHNPQWQTETTEVGTQPTTATIPNALESWNKYEITDGFPEFSNAINTNPIDIAYLQEKNSATTTGEFVELEKKYISLWQKELEISTEYFLSVLTDEDAKLFLMDQENWICAIDADLQLTNDILSEYAYSLPQGLTLSQLLLSEKRDLYRERTIKIKYLHYLIETSAESNGNELQSVLFH